MEQEKKLKTAMMQAGAVDAAAMDQMKGRGEGKSLMLAGDGGGSKAGEGDASDGKARK